MWKYGRKVIDALFKRRTERTPVRAELERRSEADSSRSDIRVFEVGLSAERHGDYEQGTRNAAQTAEGARLIAMHAQDAIYEHLIHNILFPNTRYRFEGISEDADGVRIILSQPYISDQYVMPTQESIDRYLIEGLGLHHENRYFYGNEFLAVTDVSADGDNVLTDGERLYFIDPIIKLKASAVDVLNYYYGVLK